MSQPPTPTTGALEDIGIRRTLARRRLDVARRLGRREELMDEPSRRERRERAP